MIFPLREDRQLDRLRARANANLQKAKDSLDNRKGVEQDLESLMNSYKYASKGDLKRGDAELNKINNPKLV